MSLRKLGLLASVLLLAGCLGSTPAGPRSTATEPTASVTLEDGGIEGLVVTDEYLPIPGANVTIIGTKLSANASATGRFAFGPLPPGDYLVRVTAVNFRQRQVGVTVLPGEITTARIVMQAIPGPAPYLDTTYMLNGYLNLGVNVSAAGQGYNTVGSSGTAVPEGYRTKNSGSVSAKTGNVWHEILYEIRWTSGTAFADDLMLRPTLPSRSGTSCTYSYSYVAAMGKSPIRYRFDHAELKRLIGLNPDLCSRPGNATSIDFAVLPAAGQNENLGLHVAQSFTLYTTIAYNMPMPPSHTRLPG